MLRRLRLATLALTLALAPSALAQDSGAIPDEAKAYFKNGVDLLHEATPNYQDAFVQFRLAYERSNKSWKVLGNLGFCAIKLERDGEALGYYTDYLKRGGTAIDPSERADIERDVLLLRGNLVTITLSGRGLTQVVDARQGSSVPPQVYKAEAGSLSLSVRAGTHALTATNAAGASEKWEVVLSPGQASSHTFFGPSAPVAAPPSAASATPPPPHDTSDPKPPAGGGSRTGAYVALGVGGVGILAGAAFGLMAKSSESSGNDQCRGNLCPERSRSDFDSAKSKALMSNIGFGVGLVGLGVGGTLLVLSKGKSQEARVTTMPGGAGLVWEGKL